MTILLVDDDFNARRTLRKLLSDEFEDLTFINDASNIGEAVLQLKEGEPDLVFSDIQLGQKKSFELFTKMKVNCPIIFVTAYDSFALEAYNNLAIGYILKPIDRQMLYKTFEHARHLIGNIKQQPTEPKKKHIKKLILPGNREAKTVNINAIQYLKANGVYCQTFLSNATCILCSKPLRYFEERLEEQENFFRTHKSYMVNLTKIQSIASDFSYVKVSSEVLIPVSRNKRDQLKQIMKEQFY